MAILEHTGPLTVNVEPGEVVSVLGAPGSGKSRLALELAFLARPSEGEVFFHGVNPMRRRSRLEPAQRPREVTLLVQNAEDQLFARSVFDDVAFGPKHLNLSQDEIGERVVRALEAVGLNAAEVKGRSPFALSGGERRRVALAGVLAMEPEVLILDEPTASLDPHTRSQFLDLLTPLRGRSAIVWLTTSAREAALADRIYLLHDGRTAEAGKREALLKEWRALADAGVELPSVYELAALLQRHGWELPETAAPADLESAIVKTWWSRHRDR